MELKSNPRAKRNIRKIRLLSLGVDVAMYPDSWRQSAQAKEFDGQGTSILRTFRHLTEDKYLVYGMRASKDGSKAKVDVEAYELVAAAEALPAALAKVAEHCGLNALVSQIA